MGVDHRMTVATSAGKKGRLAVPKVAFLGTLSSSFADRVRPHLNVESDFIHTDEENAVDVLPEVDVLVTLVFTLSRARASSPWP